MMMHVYSVKMNVNQTIINTTQCNLKSSSSYMYFVGGFTSLLRVL